MSKKKGKEKADAPKAAAEPAPEIPISSARLPLELLEPQMLGEFLELCFADRRLLTLCGELKLYSPGYRIEQMPPNQVARMLADEALAAKDAMLLLDKAVRDSLRNPALEMQLVTADGYRDLLELFTGDALQHVARIAWRALLEEDEKLREYGPVAIDLGVELLDQMSEKPTAVQRKPPPPGAKEAEEAVRRAERAEKDSAAMKEQLALARADIAEREQSLFAERREARELRVELERVSAELSRLERAGEGRALSDARRLADEARSLTEKLRVAVSERDALSDRASMLDKKLAAQPATPLPQMAASDEMPSEEEAASFLIPVFTREFYDSIDRWAPRMQRAAFDKIHLLAHDWHHGSLRAIALEGLPGYYRIRVATDVRLIYRRDGLKLDILSLIDREDLDRYIRQARTRQT